MDEQDPRAPRRAAQLSAARRQSILGLVSRGDIVAVGDLAGRLGVSLETIRRDMRALEGAGHLRRVHGGAAPVGPVGPVDLTARRPVEERLALSRDTKIAAARAALPAFETGMTVFLGGSSTMLLLAELLAGSDLALSVTTNMVDIATRLAEPGNCKVTLLGGILKPATRTLVGPDMLRALDRQLFDLAVCGASGVDPMHGFLGPSAWHAEIGAKLAERCRRLGFVVDGTKLGRSDAFVVQPLERVSFLATDVTPQAEFASAFDAAGIHVMLPPAAASSAAPRVENT